MSESKELKKGNGEQPENEKQEEVEGYSYCDSHKQRCLRCWHVILSLPA